MLLCYLLCPLDPAVIGIFLYHHLSASALCCVSVLLLIGREFFFAKTWRYFKWVGNSKEKGP